jgi:hypothetical protein
VPLFWGIYGLFFSNFFYLRGVSVGGVSELEIPKSEGHLLKPGNYFRVPFSVEWANGHRLDPEVV